LGLDPYEFLPEINFEGMEVKEPSDIAIRLVILCLLIEVSLERLSGDLAKSFFIRNDLIEFLTDKEKKLLSTNDRQFKINETWKLECASVFFWYLGIIEDLPSPKDPFDISSVSYYPITSLNDSSSEFINYGFKVRKKNEVYFYLDLYARLDYICDMAAINEFKTGLNSAAIYERRYALIWLSNATVMDWEDIKCESIY
jgi:hypothetical protein